MHKCVRCRKIYQDNDSSILKGCSCGSVLFVYMRTPNDAEEIGKIEKELQSKQTNLEKEITKKIESKKAEAKSKISEEKIKIEAGKPKFRAIKFGIETVRIPREGVYEINIDALMKKRPLIILEKERVYFIHLPSIFEKFKE